jgi:hypothetical protein
VGVLVLTFVGVADVGDDVLYIAEGVLVGDEIEALVGFEDGMELGFLVGANVVTDTEAVVFQVTPVAFKSLMIVSDVSFANVPFLSAPNAFAVSFCSVLTKSPSQRALFVTFSAISASDVVVARFAQSV